MSRRFLVVIEDAKSEFDNPESLEAVLSAFFEELGMKGAVAAVRPGGLLAMMVLEELPPVRHKDQGVYR